MTGPFAFDPNNDTSLNPTGASASSSLAGSDVVPVPLPAGGFLLLTGLGGIAAHRRRRKRAS
ncbi:MAG: VPLPA-CTERM sorting domain-containing protein [Paracoccaceae bacterium]